MREHANAARQKARQPVLSVCTILRDRERYGKWTPEIHMRERDNVPEYNEDTFRATLAALDAQWLKIKVCTMLLLILIPPRLSI